MKQAQTDMQRAAWGVALVLLVAPTVLSAAEIHVAPGGSPEGDGSRAKPLDLATALSTKSPAEPGDTILLAAGTYRGGFVSHLEGTADKPITVRPIGNKRATIDAVGQKGSGLSIRGAWTEWRGIEVTCSDPKRTSRIRGPLGEAFQRPTGILVRGMDLRLVHCVVHDCGHGINSWTESRGAEIYGCIVYNNGWQGPLTGHGRGIRAQNRSGIKHIADNIIFNNFAYGLHVYTDISHIRSLTVDGNVAFNNGCLAKLDQRAANLFIGSPEQPARGMVFTNNHAWHDHQTATTAQLGMGLANRDLVATDNILVGLTRVMGWKDIVLHSNTFISAATAMEFHLPKATKVAEHSWDKNRYYCRRSDWSPFALYTATSGGGLDFAGWQRQSGFDAGSTFHAAWPKITQVAVRPSRHTSGRANIIVYNWGGDKQVEVDLKSVLPVGTEYVVLSAQDPFGKPVLNDMFDGKPLSIPTAGRKAAPPVGGSPSAPPVTGPLFNVFVLVPLGEP